MRDKFINKKNTSVNQLTRNTLARIVYVFLAILIGLSESQILSASEVAHPVPIPSQRRAYEVWQKILTLTSQRNGYVSKEDFEKTFDISLGKAVPVGMNAESYTIHQGKDWIFDVNLVNAVNVPFAPEGGRRRSA